MRNRLLSTAIPRILALVIDIEKMIGRVVELHGQRARIFTGDDYIDAILKGKVKYGERDSSPIAVGDYVRYSIAPGETAAVEAIEKRESVLSKPAVEKEGLVQVMVANIDRVIIVSSVKKPKFKPGLIDRFLVTALKEEIKPVIVLNKIDLGIPEIIHEYFKGWSEISCQTIFTSALTGEGMDELKETLRQGTSVISGHSGVGKSSLLNKISPELNLKTKKVSSSSNRGVHTTSRMSLYRIFPEGWVADTPGLKVFGLTGVTRKTLHEYYPEFDELRLDCRFDDCIHIGEPDCAVKKSVENSDGSIAGFRYESYLRIYADL
ncbi:MAG: ribosome small subunit-dependent GTPase A [candidate division Zixibacteria bacterium]